MTTAYEYELLRVEPHEEDSRYFKGQLDQLGAEGWLLVLELDSGMLVFTRPTPPPSPNQAAKAVLTIKGANGMATLAIVVGDTGAAASLVFEDAEGDPTSPPLSSDGVTPVVVEYTTDTPSIATIDPSTGALTAVLAGNVGVGATVNDAITGAPALEPDGVTPWAPAPVQVTVNPGAATQDVFTVADPSGT